MSAELVVLGTVRTGVDGGRGPARGEPRGDTTALAVRDGRIAALGAEAEALASGAAEVVRTGPGELVAPAFGDGHAHPLFGGLEQCGPQVGNCESVDEVVAEVGRWAAGHPAETWITGGFYDPSLAPGGEFDARWLDDAVPDRPVVLHAQDHHTLWCNSDALCRAGITDGTPEPRLGSIVRRLDGSPMGTLREGHACAPVLDLLPPRGTDELVEVLRAASRSRAAAGVTWVQEAWAESQMVDTYLEAAHRGALSVRVNLAQRADPDRWREQRPAFHRARRYVEEAGDPLLSARTVTFFSDGVIESGTAALLAPYADAPHSHGMPVWEPEALAEAVTVFDADGFQVHIHAAGDAGVRAALDAVEAAERANPLWDRRPVIAHVQLVDPTDLPRFAQLGVIAGFEPLRAQPGRLQTELTLPRLGERRGVLQYPMGELARSGARLSFGSGRPTSSHVPLEGIRTAVTRRTPGGVPAGGWTAHQLLTVGEALEAATAGVAHQAFADERATLTTGAPADLVWLSADPRIVDPMSLGDIRVRGTWLAGRATHRA